MKLKSNYKTDQEEFWAGKFGTDYIDRNKGTKLLASNLNFFSKALSQVNNVNNCIEFGANIGMNLKALNLLYPNMELSAIEINKDAVKELKELISPHNVYNNSILEWSPTTKYDLVLIKGVLIHINPDYLPDLYNLIYNSSKKYILLCEYYNPTPIKVEYRGESDRLFKRDFAGDILEKFKDIRLVDYGFCYHLDSSFPQDDITWFLLKKI